MKFDKSYSRSGLRCEPAWKKVAKTKKTVKAVLQHVHKPVATFRAEPMPVVKEEDVGSDDEKKEEVRESGYEEEKDQRGRVEKKRNIMKARKFKDMKDLSGIFDTSRAEESGSDAAQEAGKVVRSRGRQVDTSSEVDTDTGAASRDTRTASRVDTQISVTSLVDTDISAISVVDTEVSVASVVDTDTRVALLA